VNLRPTHVYDDLNQRQLRFDKKIEVDKQRIQSTLRDAGFNKEYAILNGSDREEWASNLERFLLFFNTWIIVYL